MRVALIHAYSTTNSGDGLLVDEARGLVREAFPDSVIDLFAMDPTSFDASDYDTILHPLTGRDHEPSGYKVLARGVVAMAFSRRNGAVRQALSNADLVVAVGGGYLRAKNPVEALKTLAAHVPQLPRSMASTVYLPQSIGPLRYGVSHLVRRRLRNASVVHLRDDRSLAELRPLDNGRRSPDLALLGLPEVWARSAVSGPGQHVGVVARELPGSRLRRRSYIDALQATLSALPSSELLVQANARGNNDVDFYHLSLGAKGPHRTLKEATVPGAADRPSCVISVRLHGALESVRNGVPSIHLSYERKGWGAYGDLGLTQYVHNAYGFTPQNVADQALALKEDSTHYWDSVESACGALRARRAELVDELRTLATTGA